MIYSNVSGRDGGLSHGSIQEESIALVKWRVNHDWLELLWRMIHSAVSHFPPEICQNNKDRLARISCEILLHIILDPTLACLVKDMTLVVYMTQPVSFKNAWIYWASGSQFPTYPYCIVTKALHNLRVLRCCYVVMGRMHGRDARISFRQSHQVLSLLPVPRTLNLFFICLI